MEVLDISRRTQPRKIRRYHSSSKRKMITTSIRPSNSCLTFNSQNNSNGSFYHSSLRDDIREHKIKSTQLKRKRKSTLKSVQNLDPIQVFETRNSTPLNLHQDKIEKSSQRKTKASRCRYPLPCLIATSCCMALLAIALAIGLIIGLMKPNTSTSTSPTTSTTSTSTTTTTTTSTTSMTSSTSSTSTTSTSTTTTTTTTARICGITCVNDTFSNSSLIASYSFDSTVTDSTGVYSMVNSVSSTYVPGWIGSAITFDAANARGLNASNLPISGRSFSIDVWFYALNVSSGWDIPFVGQHAAQAVSQSLFCSIYMLRLYFGLFADDSIGTTDLQSHTWYHAAFIYDNATRQRYIYLNGQLESQATGVGPLQAPTGSFTVGWARIGGRVSTFSSYYTGYLDQLTISRRVKSACEIYLIANLACYLKFDSSSLTLDSGPNRLTVSNTGGISITGGRVNQAIQFASPSTSITISDVSALKFPANSFSISMWINPTNVNGGTLIHTSAQINGQGKCMTMWGFTAAGVLVVNVLDPSNNTVSVTSTSALSTNNWTHVVQTWSPTNGCRLYIDGFLVATMNAPTGQPVGPFVIIGTSPAATSYCPHGTIMTGQYYGSVDEYRIFRTELTSDDVCHLATV